MKETKDLCCQLNSIMYCNSCNWRICGVCYSMLIGNWGGEERQVATHNYHGFCDKPILIKIKGTL